MDQQLPTYTLKDGLKTLYVYRCPDENFLPSHQVTVRKKLSYSC